MPIRKCERPNFAAIAPARLELGTAGASSHALETFVHAEHGGLIAAPAALPPLPPAAVPPRPAEAFCFPAAPPPERPPLAVPPAPPAVALLPPPLAVLPPVAALDPPPPAEDVDDFPVPPPQLAKPRSKSNVVFLASNRTSQLYHEAGSQFTTRGSVRAGRDADSETDALAGRRALMCARG
jgi:hypothetical protein